MKVKREKYSYMMPGSGYIEWEGDEPIITLSKSAKSNVLLHEMGHAEYGHRPVEVSPRELVDREVDAELYRYKVKGKKPDWKVCSKGLVNLASFGEAPDVIVSVVLDSLGAHGIRVTGLEEERISDFAYGYSDLGTLFGEGEEVSA